MIINASPAGISQVCTPEGRDNCCVAWEVFWLEEAGDAFFEDKDSVLNSRGAGFLFEELQRLVHRFVREPEGTVMHGHHPAGFEIEKGLSGVGGIGVDVAELRRVVGADGQQSKLRSKTTSDFAEAGEICGIAGVIDRVFAGLQHESPIAAVRVFQDAGAPVARRHVGHGDIAVAGGLPPVEFDDLGKSEIRNQVSNMGRNHDGGRYSPRAEIVVDDGAQRRTVQVIEVRMRYQHEVNRWKVGDPQSRAAQPFQNKEPARKIGVDHHTLPADLHKEARVPDERDPEFPVGCEAWGVSLAASPGDGRMANESRELRSALAKGRIPECLLDHPALEASGMENDATPEKHPYILDDPGLWQAAF